MVDRKARDRMAAALRAYMAEEITAFKLDEELNETADATQDETVKKLAHYLWFFYDDIADHKVVGSKEAWGFFNRVLLFLESDKEIEIIQTIKGPWRWHYFQAIAAICLAAFVTLAFKTGVGEHLFIYAVPFGLVSMLLAWLSFRRDRNANRAVEAETVPFASASSLLSVRRRVAGFSRMRYPKTIAGRRVRGPVVEKIMWLPAIAAWLAFSPVVLLFQMLPEREATWKVKMPEKAPDFPS